MKSLRSPDVLALKHISVLLADDHAAFRKSIKVLIESDGDIQVIKEAKNGSEAVRLTLSLHPEVIVMDLAMPILTGLQATRQIMEAWPAAKVLILSAHPEPEYIKQAVTLGASGYLIKQSSSHLLAQAIREVMKGKTCFNPPASKHPHHGCARSRERPT
jgi:DNA-binding NarL/FixJ family response regulator